LLLNSWLHESQPTSFEKYFRIAFFSYEIMSIILIELFSWLNFFRKEV
jgi:hypothetical protein